MTTGLPKEAKPRDRRYDRGHDAVRADEKTMKPSQPDPKQVPGSRFKKHRPPALLSSEVTQAKN